MTFLREMKKREKRITGTFRPGENAPTEYSHFWKACWDHNFSAQIELTVGEHGEETERLIWLQVLLDVAREKREKRHIMARVNI